MLKYIVPLNLKISVDLSISFSGNVDYKAFAHQITTGAAEELSKVN
jgi:hypothetical protein